jgi:hypothetical protein
VFQTLHGAPVNACVLGEDARTPVGLRAECQKINCQLLKRFCRCRCWLRHLRSVYTGFAGVAAYEAE